MEDWSDFHKKNKCASFTDKPSSGSLRRNKHSYSPSAMNLGKNRIKILLSKAKSLLYFPLLFYLPLPCSLLWSFTFHLKILPLPSRRTRHKSHQTRHQAQSAAAGHGKGSAGVLVTGTMGLRLGPEMQCVSSQPVLNLHLAPLCFGHILLLMLIAAMGLWAKPNKQLYVFPINKPDFFLFFLLFWCHPNAGIVINHREMCY